MKKKGLTILYLLTLSFALSIAKSGLSCVDSLHFDMVDEWDIDATFRIDKIKTYYCHRSDSSTNTNDSQQKIYLIYVSCMDSCHFPKLDYIYGFPETYKGINFTIISFDNPSESKCNYTIKRGMILHLSLQPWYGFWSINDYNDWIINGTTIPYKMIKGQPMKTEELKGLEYCPKNDNFHY